MPRTTCQFAVFILILNLVSTTLAATPPRFARLESLPPEDPYQSRQTGLKAAQLFEADKIFYHSQTGLSERAIVGVVDRGEINLRHPELDGVLKTVVTLPTPPNDDDDEKSDHAFKVIGVLAARAFNGIGIRGVAGTHTDIHYRGVNNDAEAAAAITTLLDLGVHVISISLGVPLACGVPNDSRTWPLRPGPIEPQTFAEESAAPPLSRRRALIEAMRELAGLAGNELRPGVENAPSDGHTIAVAPPEERILAPAPTPERVLPPVPKPGLAPPSRPPFRSAREPEKKCQHPLTFGARFKAVLHRAVFEKNVLVVVAAGNTSTLIPVVNEEFMKGVIVVGASDNRQRVASYSNHGPGVTMFSPDADIWSLSPRDVDEAGHGTSLTTPIVSGAAALAVSYLRTHQVAYTAPELRDLITKSAQPYPGLANRAEFGASLNFLNLAKALQTFVQRKTQNP